MKEYFVIQYWPECNDRPEPLCVVPSRADAEEMVLAFYEGAPYDAYLESIEIWGDAFIEEFEDDLFKYDYFYEKVNIIE